MSSSSYSSILDGSLIPQRGPVVKTDDIHWSTRSKIGHRYYDDPRTRNRRSTPGGTSTNSVGSSRVESRALLHTLPVQSYAFCIVFHFLAFERASPATSVDITAILDKFGEAPAALFVVQPRVDTHDRLFVERQFRYHIWRTTMAATKCKRNQRSKFAIFVCSELWAFNSRISDTNVKRYSVKTQNLRGLLQVQFSWIHHCDFIPSLRTDVSEQMWLFAILKPIMIL